MGLLVTSFGLICILKLYSCAVSYAGCDYSYNYPSNTVGYVQSPNWSNYYKGGTNCRFTIQAPARHYLYAQCYDMYLPSSYGCYYDKLLVSPTGNNALADAEVRCGSTTFNVASTGNKMVIALQTLTQSTGGRFRCQITAVPLKCDCGTRLTPLIVGGESTQPNEYPMAAAIIEISSKSLVCGATIITDRHSLTAAHCVSGRSISNSALLVGDHNMKTGTDTAYAKAMLISTFTVNSAYDSKTKTNDIALVRTTDQIVFNPGVNRACLPYAYTSSSFNNVYLTTLGWGTLDFGGPMATDLQKVALQVMDLATCRSKLSGMNTVQDNQICTYTAGKDSCQFDSGGPMLYVDASGGKMYAIGVINYGITCASKYPSVSARVTSYLNWIETNTGFSFCEKT
ncbi:venom serine protease-like [Malaya genurostris]|uniref:venom serine protease-like n=1 Tax=Malaya genurostris TaxID=325434 RepID=UPI0026F403FD|nr:venom serine protease-like [Malaya genurostris]XP_058460909.1 venom serine protease-like [Malaya genurostris]